MDRKNFLSRLTKRLIQRRDALRRTLRDDLDDFRKASEGGGVGDDADAALDSTNEEVCSQLVELESRELAQIEHALQQITLGAYGRCESCGRKISATRLDALPYTNRCIECQREAERRGPAMAWHPDWNPRLWAAVDARRIDEDEGDEPIDFTMFDPDFRSIGRQPIDHLLRLSGCRG